MSTIDLGAPVKSIWAGAPAGGTHAVALTRPDGTSFTPPAVTGPPVSVEFIPDMAGRWTVRWTSTGSGTVSAYTDIADVWPQDPRFIVSIDDARNALSMPLNVDPSTLDDLRLYVAAATPVIEDICGPVIVKSVTQTVEKGWSYAALYERVSTLTSVINADLTVVPADSYTFEIGPGLLTFNSPTTQRVTITYTTGAAIIPQNVRLAARELIRHWWQIGRQGMRSQNNNLPITADAWTPSGFAVPRRVIELCEPSKKIGGFA